MGHIFWFSSILCYSRNFSFLLPTPFAPLGMQCSSITSIKEMPHTHWDGGCLLCDQLASVTGHCHCGGGMWWVVEWWVVENWCVNSQHYLSFSDVPWPCCVLGGVCITSTRLCQDGCWWWGGGKSQFPGTIVLCQGCPTYGPQAQCGPIQNLKFT